MVRALLTPRMIGVHLLALAAIAATVGLGIWQYDAWGRHRAEESTSLSRAPVVPLERLLGPDSPFPNDIVGRRVHLSGHWLPAGTVFVADRPHAGRDGFWAMTPVAVDGTTSAMLVVRGWTPTAKAAPVAGSTEITGWLQPPEGSGIGDAHPRDDVLPEVRIADAIQHLDTDLYGGFVVDSESTQGLAAIGPPSLPPPSRFTGLRNLLYGLEWWVFAAFAAYVWVRRCRDEMGREAAGDESVG